MPACSVKSAVSDSLGPCGQPGPARLLPAWGSPGRNTGVGCHAFLKEGLIVFCFLNICWSGEIFIFFFFWMIFSSILLWQFFLSTLGINHPTFSWPSRFLLRDLLRSKWRLFSKFQGFCIVSLFVFSTCCLKASLFFFDFWNFIINVCCRGFFKLIWFGHL